MTRINLLPWREARRTQKQRDFMGILVGAVVVAALGVLLAHLHISRLLENQEARNEFMRNEIAKLAAVEKEIKQMQESENRVRSRLEAIQGLQRSRPDIVKAFDGLVRLVPGDIFVTSLLSEGKQFTLKGAARTNNILSDFMRDLDQSPLFGEPVLKVIENKNLVKEVPASTFELAVSRTPPSDNAQNGGQPQ